MEKKRYAGLDLTRCVAILFVILHHSVTHLGLMGLEYSSIGFLSGLYLRELTYACVPLFLLLSGYLQRSKKPELSFYKGIFPLYLSYGIISILSLSAIAVYTGTWSFDPLDAIYKILNFSANDYAWYFEMFIGLFLLIPFLNTMYNNIPSKKAKLILILSLSFLTFMPETIRGFAPYYSDSSLSALNIFPDFFTAMYPLTYYLIGAYISEYRPKLNKWFKLPAVLLAALIPTAITAAFTYSRGAYAWYMLNGFQNICVALTAVTVFLALYDIDIKSSSVCAVLKTVSLCSFEMYLFSFIFDGFIYSRIGIPKILMPLCVFALSFAAAFILRLILAPLNRFIDNIFARANQNV